MRQLFIDTIAALREADNEREMKLIILAMNVQLPVGFHVYVGIRHHKIWAKRPISTKRRVYINSVRDHLTVWNLMREKGLL